MHRLVHSKIYIAVLIISMHFMATTVCHAKQDIPVPERKIEALDAFNKRLDEEKKQESELQGTVNALKKDVLSTQSKLVDIAKKIQDNERDIADLETRMSNLELRKSILVDTLAEDNKSIAKLVLALERVSRIPPEAMLARPQTPYKTAQGALVMGNIVPALRRHSDKVNKNLETLQQVTNELSEDRLKLERASLSLNDQHNQLQDLVSKRRDMYESAQSDLKTKEVIIQKISLQAKDLEDLVKKLEKEELERSAQLSKSLLRTKPIFDFKNNNSNDVQLPLSGIIRTGFHQQDTIGAQSNGISIEGRPGAIVVAPMSGKIKFTGNFKRYGKIIIIEHHDGYHSLVAGVGEINAIIGDFVNCGEPIGLLPNSSLIPRPTLYYEIRKDGVPVNPSEKFPDLG